MKNEQKYILDCCCGSRMFWFNRNHPNVVFADIRSEDIEICYGRSISVRPDVIADFRQLPFPDNSFKMVVFDPPHLNKLGQNTWMAQKYGVLLPTWEEDIKQGFSEAMRVLEPFGTLILKWNEVQITTSKILKVIGVEPLFGHPTGKHGRTIWLSFMKGVTNQPA